MNNGSVDTNWFALEGFVGLERQEQRALTSELLDLINGVQLYASSINELGKRGLIGEVEFDLSVFLDNIPAMELRRMSRFGFAAESTIVNIPTWHIGHVAAEGQTSISPALLGAIDMRGNSSPAPQELKSYFYVTQGLELPEATCVELAINPKTDPVGLASGALALVSARQWIPKTLSID